MNKWKKKWLITTGFVCAIGVYLLKNNGITLHAAGKFISFQQAQDAAENW